MGVTKEWRLSLLEEHGMKKIDKLYSVTCNIHHIVKPLLGDEDLNILASQHTDFMAQEDTVKAGSYKCKYASFGQDSWRHLVFCWILSSIKRRFTKQSKSLQDLRSKVTQLGANTG